ncbi:MAG: zinc-dependent metalloprotease [Armatimonadetes bacterium]|nr:zinc-dependent metalloprotease [Armatimonadota bacterium]
MRPPQMIFLPIIVSLALSGHAFAVPPGEPAMPAEAKAKEQPATKQEPTTDIKSTEKYESTIKGLERIGGAFPVYLRGHEILLELTEAHLGDTFMMQTTLGTGVSPVLQAGDPVGDSTADVYRWERDDNRIMLVRPNLRFRWSSTHLLNEAAERSFPEAILGDFRIEAEDTVNKKILVNATALFMNQARLVSEALSMAVGGQYTLDRELSAVDEVKGFHDETVLRMHFHFSGTRGGSEMNPLAILLGIMRPENQLEDTRSVPLELSYHLWYRPEEEIMPRLADPRVGFFTQSFYSLDRFFKPDRTERFIDRVHFEQKPGTKEVKNPMVWVLDKSIPTAYRESVKEGILRWNKAFEKIGLKGALVVTTDTDKYYNHADTRYNVVRWTLSPSTAYSLAIPRIDPITGEILSASITFDANFLAYALAEHQDFAAPAASNVARAAQAALRLEKKDFTTDQLIWESDEWMAKQRFNRALTQRGFNVMRCEYAEGLAHSAGLGLNMMEAIAGMKVDRESYARQFISDVICHEVGHCLGLRHNFEGSTARSLAELNDDRFLATNGMSASVMDYLPVNVQAVLKGRGVFFSPVIGSYDEWAIKYGYTPIEADTPDDERFKLQTIAAESTQPGHAYNSDENVDSWDPYVVAYDDGNDPIAYSEKLLQAAQKMRNYAIAKLPTPGESYEHRTRLILASVIESFRQGRMAARFVGGLHARREFATGAHNQATLSPVNPALQRQAVQLIARHCLSRDAFEMPPNVLSNLTEDNYEGQTWTAPMREILARLQSMMVATMLSAETTDRVAENSFKIGGKDDYSLDEHYAAVLSSVFSEVGNSTRIDPVRRDLQRFTLQILIDQASAPSLAISEDARSIASDALRRLQARYAAAEPKATDRMTQLYLRECRTAISKGLTADKPR